MSPLAAEGFFIFKCPFLHQHGTALSPSSVKSYTNRKKAAICLIKLKTWTMEAAIVIILRLNHPLCQALFSYLAHTYWQFQCCGQWYGRERKPGNYMSKCLEMLVNMVLYDIRDNYCNMNGSEGDGNGSQKLASNWTCTIKTWIHWIPVCGNLPRYS
jgi:hypothetical protein